MGRVLERTVSRTVAVVIAAFAGFLLLGTIFFDASWVGRMYLVAWALVPFLLIAVGLVVYFETTVFDDDEDPTPPDPLSVLRERYARGEVDDAEFERRTERLLETESTSGTEPLRPAADPSEVTRR